MLALLKTSSLIFCPSITFSPKGTNAYLLSYPIPVDFHSKDAFSSFLFFSSTTPELVEFYEEIEQSIESLLKEMKTKIKSDKKDVDVVFDTYQYRVRFITDYVTRKVYWYSFVKTAATCDIEKAYVLFNSESDREMAKSDVINTKAFSYEDIPAYHSFCDCKVTLDKEEYNKQK